MPNRVLALLRRLYPVVTGLLCLQLFFSAVSCRENKSPFWSAGNYNPVNTDNPFKLDGPEAMHLPVMYGSRSSQSMVSAANALAVKAGLEMLKKGGNAVDALLAVQWALNVVEPQSSGIGGGAFVLLFHKGKIKAIDGREEQPAAAPADMFLKDGKPLPFFPDRVTGGLPVGVPGTVAAMYYAKQHYGSNRVSWADTFAPAIEYARRGIVISPRLATAIGLNYKRILHFKATRQIFTDENGPLQAGSVLLQNELASTLELLASQGPDVFYRGEIADAIVEAVRENSWRAGYMQKSDLSRYMAVERRPLSVNFRQHQVYTMPPPSSAAALLQSLAILNTFSPAQVNQNTLTGRHLKLESEKLAFADRNRYMADPDFTVDELQPLLSTPYIAARRALISTTQALPAPVGYGQPGDWPQWKRYAAKNKPAGHPDSKSGNSTSHISIIDKSGMAVSCTTTIETSFGSAMVVEGYGFLLNNELTDFHPMPGHINSVEPGLKKRKSALGEAASRPGAKRPRSSMSPVIVVKDGRAVLVAGSPGGSRIPGVVNQVLLSVLNDGAGLDRAVSMPRVLHRNSAEAEIEAMLSGSSLNKGLHKLGHKVKETGYFNRVYGGVHAIHFSGGQYHGVADIRREGDAAGL